MKPFDLLLLSVAIGLTSFTAYMFCTGGAPIEASASDSRIQAPRNPAFRSIILHHSATHGGSAAAFERNHRTRLGGLAYHFVIGNGSGAADGAVEVGYRWRDQIPGPHTKNQDVNLESIAICLVGDLEKEAPTKKQRIGSAPIARWIPKRCVPAAGCRSRASAAPSRTGWLRSAPGRPGNQGSSESLHWPATRCQCIVNS
jgi:hypothetical protein